MQGSKLQSVKEELEHISVKCTDAALFTEDFHKTLTSMVKENPHLQTVEFYIFLLDTTLCKRKMKEMGIVDKTCIYRFSMLFSVGDTLKKYKHPSSAAKALEIMLFKHFKTLVTIH